MHSHSARLLSSSGQTRSVWHSGPPSDEGGRVGPPARTLNARTAVAFIGARAGLLGQAGRSPLLLYSVTRSMPFGDAD